MKPKLSRRRARQLASMRKTHGAGPGRPRRKRLRHGTHNAYRTHKCRCKACRAFMAAYQRARVAKNAPE